MHPREGGAKAQKQDAIGKKQSELGGAFQVPPPAAVQRKGQTADGAAELSWDPGTARAEEKETSLPPVHAPARRADHSSERTTLPLSTVL
jgi:hypothetical protein